jgi:hypothetical protein
MADTQSSGGSSTAMVAIVAIVLLVLMGFLFLRGRHGGAGTGSGPKGSVEINVPRPGAPGK